MNRKICLVSVVFLLSFHSFAQDTGEKGREKVSDSLQKVTLLVEVLENVQSEMPKEVDDRDEEKKRYKGMYDLAASELRGLLDRDLSSDDQAKVDSLVKRFNIAVLKGSYLTFFKVVRNEVTHRRERRYRRMLTGSEVIYLLIARQSQAIEEDELFEEALSSYDIDRDPQRESDYFRAIRFRLEEVEGFYAKVLVFLTPYKSWEEVKPVSRWVKNRFVAQAHLFFLDDPPWNRRMYFKTLKVARKVSRFEHVEALKLFLKKYDDLTCGGLIGAIARRTVSPLNYVTQVESPEQLAVFTYFNEQFFDLSSGKWNWDNKEWEGEETKEWMFPAVFDRLGAVKSEATAQALTWGYSVALDQNLDPKQVSEWAFGVKDDFVFTEFRVALVKLPVDSSVREFLDRLKTQSKAK